MKVLFVVAEANPFAKTGGLGDVGGSLPVALNKHRGNIRVIIPQYSSIPLDLAKKIRHITSFTVELGWRKQYCGLGELNYQDVHYYFIDNKYYFNREKLYGYEDDAERFAFFNKAVLESLLHLEDFQPNIIHCHDWHTSLIPLMLKEYYADNPFYYKIKTLFTIHNLKHQGIFPKSISEDFLPLEGRTKAFESLEFHGGLNFLKGALLYTDGITTVSPTYAMEIQDPYYGEGLDSVLRQQKDRLCGILNGIDQNNYNPKTDSNIFVKYSNFKEGKLENKRKLQEFLNLPVNKETPILALISRLDSQKGLDLVGGILEELLQGNLQLVVLGTGEKKYEDMFHYFQYKYPDKIATRIMFDEALARKIYAGADLLLMPSLYEPCGLSQMIAMAYGTIPIVRETGGLKDSVIPYNQYSGEGNGFSFANYNAHEFLFTIQRALKVYLEDENSWHQIMTNAGKTDFSWDSSAMRYLELYEALIEGD